MALKNAEDRMLRSEPKAEPKPHPLKQYRTRFAIGPYVKGHVFAPVGVYREALLNRGAIEPGRVISGPDGKDLFVPDANVPAAIERPLLTRRKA